MAKQFAFKASTTAALEQEQAKTRARKSRARKVVEAEVLDIEPTKVTDDEAMSRFHTAVNETLQHFKVKVSFRSVIAFISAVAVGVFGFYTGVVLSSVMALVANAITGVWAMGFLIGMISSILSASAVLKAVNMTHSFVMDFNTKVVTQPIAIVRGWFARTPKGAAA